MNKKYLLLLIIVFISLGGFCLATTLEVTYPDTSHIAGGALAAGSDLPEFFFYWYRLLVDIAYVVIILCFIYAGVLYILSPIKPAWKVVAKDRAIGAVIALIILLLISLIIEIINPSLGIFKQTSLIAVPSTPPETITFNSPGLVVFLKANCENNSSSTKATPNYKLFSTSQGSLGSFTNKVKSVKIVNNAENDLSFIAVLYDKIGYKGLCQYIDQTETTCSKSNISFASSASIYRYEFNPTKGSVTFYRRSFFDDQKDKVGLESGGSLKIDYENIKNSDKVYDLRTLSFTGTPGGECNVPENERDCPEINFEGKCLKERTCPKLAGNISSVKIDGEFFVLLVYFDENAEGGKQWAECQGFPTSKDFNTNGPNQIKWEYISNDDKSQLVNYALIFPVKDNKQ